MHRLLLVLGLTAITTACAATAPTQAAAPASAPVSAPAAAPVSAPAASTSAAAPAIPKQFHDDIMSMLQMTLGPHLGEVTKVMSTMYVSSLQVKYRNISPAVADEIRADVAKVVSDPDRQHGLEEALVPVYASLYTDEDIRQIIAFGKTPAGSKMFSGVPNQQQISSAIQVWAIGSVAPVMMMDTAQILKKHGITIDAGGGN